MNARPYSELEPNIEAQPVSRSIQRRPLLIIFVVVVIDLLGFGMVLPLLPVYAKAFSVDQSGWQLGLLMASFSAMQFFFSPIWGMVSDRIGRRPILMLGLLGSACFYFLFGLATTWESLTWIFVARIGAGICGATISTAQAYIADSTDKAGRSRGMALVGMAFGIGFTFGPVLGYLAVPESPTDKPGPWLGYSAAILSAVALIMAAFMLPESLRKSSADKSESVTNRFRLSGIRDACRIPGVPAILLLIFMVVFSFAGFETTLSLLLASELFNFNLRQLCITFALIGFTLAIIQGGVVRPLYKRLGEVPMASIGTVLEVIGFAAVAWAVHQASLWGFFASLVLVVAGFSFIQPSVNSLLSRQAPENVQGVVLGTGQSVNALGRILGSAVAIPLLMWNQLAPFVIAAILIGLSGLLLHTVIKTGAQETNNPN